MPAYRAPRGTRDLLPAERPAWRALADLARSLSDAYGYREIETEKASAKPGKNRPLRKPIRRRQSRT